VSSVKAQIDQCKSALLQARAETRQARAKVVEQEAQVKFAQTDFERYQKVWDAKAVARQAFDKAKQTHEVAIAQLSGAQQGLQAAETREVQAEASLQDAIGRLQKSKGGITRALATTQQKKVDEETHESDMWAMKKAQADLKQAQLQLSYCHIVAPVAGRIGRKSAELGQHVESGQMLMALVQENPWITANYKETQVGRMRAGQPVEISIDTFPGRKFTGTIDSVAPASGAKFSILPPDNATGNFTKVVQRVPVKIVFDPKSIADVKDALSPGMSCVVSVQFGKH
jgi:membrane fusion protein (multidrug efflux system)